MTRVISLELNELNFELVKRYVADGKLPTFAKLLAEHDLYETVAETEYSHLEPWIQWVTAHTGLTLKEHGVFRLGDIVAKEIPQIWEILEKRYGLRTGAVSPMNATNRVQRPAFFIPDPWTQTSTSGSWDLQLLSKALAQAVNDNAHGHISKSSYARLLVAAARNVRTQNLAQYAQLAGSAHRHKWRRALFLDLFLSDTFIRHCRRQAPDYATLFLNAGAHVQHHYMFSSPYYDGPYRNPTWYVPDGADPLEEVYSLYDRIIGNCISSLPGYRILLCTGLSQRPNDELINYYRPKNHSALLRLIGVDSFVEVVPRMSRDFMIKFRDQQSALLAEQVLNSYMQADRRVFFVENRGDSLFCMLQYTGEMRPDLTIHGVHGSVPLHDHVSHVSIENAVHKTTGYFLDTGADRRGGHLRIPLQDVFTKTLSFWGEA